MKSTNLITAAIVFAEKRHRAQYRKPYEAGVPYITHPMAVAAHLADCGLGSPVLLAAAYLHDVLEDTIWATVPDAREREEAELAQVISDTFGEDVLSLVYEVTDDWRLTKDHRRKHQMTHHYSPTAARLKVADKTCNVRDYAEWVRTSGGKDAREAAVAYSKRALRVRDACEQRMDERYECDRLLLSRFEAAVEDLREALNDRQD
jgi:(p)ppGpp synthase/HD superfamily hydrolase